MSDVVANLRSNIWLDAIRELADEAADTIQQMAVRYDDAMKRIQDMQAELEFLRSELARRA